MNHQPPNYKPYGFVPLPDGRALGRPPGHERLSEDRFSGWLELELETLRPLQVASGRMDFVRRPGGAEILALVPLTVRRGELLIPGSSWKGVVRSLVEAISPSCVSQCTSKIRRYVPPNLHRCLNPEALCPACSLFGTQSIASRLFFRDILIGRPEVQIVRTPLLWAPARGRQLPSVYQEGQYVRGRKFYRHGQVLTGGDARLCIKEGLRLPARIDAVNLSEAELGLLIAALGLHPDFSFPIKLGGGKPVGLGSLRVHLRRGFCWDPLALRQGGRVAFRAVENLDTRRWVTQAEREELLRRPNLQRLAEILRESLLNAPFHYPY